MPAASVRTRSARSAVPRTSCKFRPPTLPSGDPRSLTRRVQSHQPLRERVRPSCRLGDCDRQRVGLRGVTSLSPGGCSHLAEPRAHAPDISRPESTAPGGGSTCLPPQGPGLMPGGWTSLEGGGQKRRSQPHVTPFAPPAAARALAGRRGLRTRSQADGPCFSPPPQPPSLRPPSLCSLCCHNVTVPAQ